MFKRFIHYYKPYLGIFFFDLFCATIISAIDIAYPQILRIMTKTLFLEPSDIIVKTIPLIALCLFAAYVIQGFCKYYVNCQGHVMGALMERDMRRDLFEHYESMSFSYYDKNNTGQMMSRMISDLFEISEMAHHGPENIFISVIKFAGSFVFLFMINKTLTLCLCGVALCMAIFSYSQNKRMRRTFRDNRKKIGNINAILQDSFSGIRIVQAFANEEIEKEKFHKGNEEFLKSKKENYVTMGIFGGGNTFFMGMMYAVTLVAGGILISKGSMTAADLAMFSLYIGIFTSPIMIFVELTEVIQKGFSGFSRFVEIIETPQDIKDSPEACEISNPQGDICFNNVSFSYNKDEEILKNISFTIKSGKSVALAGPSGGGKTTICSLLPRFYDTTEGSITIDGQNVKDIKLHSLRSSIGIVQQDVYLFGGTIRENIEYGKPGASMEEIQDAAKKAGIHDYIMSLPNAYETECGERGIRLSGGQKQRISIARVFLKNPPILILDEATSALDNENERYIQKSLDELSKNRTTITIAHRLSTIQNADEILVIGKNGIEERGNHQELLKKNGIYARYFELT